MSVYIISHLEDEAANECYEVGFDTLDGDFMKVGPLEVEFTHGKGRDAIAKLPDGGIVQANDKTIGVRIDPTNLPKNVRFDAPNSAIRDFMKCRSCWLVSEKFKDVVERLESETHQFVPVNLTWKDGSAAATYFWFFPLTRIDSTDKQLSSHELIRDRFWMSVRGGKYVVRSDKVGEHHIWIDFCLAGSDRSHPIVSERAKNAFQDSGASGIRFGEIATV